MVRRASGFTLIEMLVSMALLSLIIMIASGAYALFNQNWHGRLGHFNQTSNLTRHLILVQESLSSIMPYVVFNKDQLPRLYFEGNRNGFVAVASRSVFNPKYAAVIRMQAIQNQDFTYSLIYQEWPMEHGVLINTTQEIPFGKPLLLFDKLSSIEFNYYGWPSLGDQVWSADGNSDIARNPQDWFSDFNSLERMVHPEQISISFINSQGEFKLQTRLTDPPPGLLSRYQRDMD
jgi:prepilin-type N-terminal cleavage/methylation domain-containing protein